MFRAGKAARLKKRILQASPAFLASLASLASTSRADCRSQVAWVRWARFEWNRERTHVGAHLHFDCYSGISGDMILGALVDVEFRFPTW